VLGKDELDEEGEKKEQQKIVQHDREQEPKSKRKKTMRVWKRSIYTA
jgi:hypothetical protein